MGFSLGTNTTSANPYTPSRGMPATPPSFGLPQNHTLSTDPFNQQAQLMSMGMLLPAFDSYGGNKGYYSNQTYQTSPLMQRYLMPQNQNSNWLQHSMGMGMPGWNANGNGTFSPGQYNPFMALNHPSNQPQFPAQTPAQPQMPQAQQPAQPPAQQAMRNPFMATAPQAQQLPSSPVVPGTNMNQREYDTMRFDGVQATQAHYDALSKQSKAALRTRAILGGDPMSADVLSQGGGMTGGISSGYINPNVLAYAKANPDSLQAKQMAAALGPNWNA